MPFSKTPNSNAKEIDVLVELDNTLHTIEIKKFATLEKLTNLLVLVV